MATSIVNGYFCFSSCDAAKARTGKNPHPKNDPGSVDGGNNSSRTNDPAVVFGGSLSNTTQAQVGGSVTGSQAVAATSGAQPDDPASSRRTGSAVDILA